MIENIIKINKNFMFTTKELLNYLKIVGKFSKLEDEILATITYKKAYTKLYKTDYLITFPYKQNHEQEILKRPLLATKDIGNFLQKHIEDNSYYDSILVNLLNNKKAMIRPLQIKFLGKGEYRGVTTNKFIRLLKKYIYHETNNATLVIVLDGPIIKIKLKYIVNWIANVSFPFSEVVLIEANNETGEMKYYQLKPTKKGVFNSLTLQRNEILAENI